MDQVKIWFRTSSPMVKMLMAISITSAVVVGHRYFYAPYSRRQRYLRAEAWANEIMEEEERLKESGEPFTTIGNLRY